MAVLPWPVVFRTSARCPRAVLPAPVVLLRRALAPTALLLRPLIVRFPALIPRKVLSAPKLWRKGTPSFRTLPSVSVELTIVRLPETSTSSLLRAEAGPVSEAQPRTRWFYSSCHYPPLRILQFT